jgi:hypothetical protein
LLEATKDDAGAFVDEAKLVVDTSIRNISNDLALDLYGSGNGVRGQLSVISTGVITLGRRLMLLTSKWAWSFTTFSISGTTATISTGSALGYVIAVNRSSGTVTVSDTGLRGSAGTPSNWSASFPNIAVQGDVSFASGGLATSSTGALKSHWSCWLAPCHGSL